MEERIQAVEAVLHERKHEFDLNLGGTPEEKPSSHLSNHDRGYTS
jgi:hypothetical protein